MKDNKGVTLLELLIAMSLLILVLFAGSGVYLSNASIYEDARQFSQAQRNAQIPIMHIKKYVKDCASNFRILNNDGMINAVGSTVEFMIFANANDIEPIIRRRYELTDGMVRYYVNYADQNSPFSIIGQHISNCTFSAPGDGHVLEVQITGMDNNDNIEGSYSLTSRIAAQAASSPAVYQVPEGDQGGGG